MQSCGEKFLCYCTEIYIGGQSCGREVEINVLVDVAWMEMGVERFMAWQWAMEISATLPEAGMVAWKRLLPLLLRARSWLVAGLA